MTVASRIVVFALFALLCGGLAPDPGTAASPASCQVELQVLRIPASTGDLDSTRFLARSELLRLVRERKVQILEAATAVGMLNDSIPILVGRKVPIVYHDPRSGDDQVQYADVGMKAMVNVTEEADGGFRVYVKADRTNLVVPTTRPRPPSQGIMAVSQLMLRPGQVALFARTRGVLTPEVMKQVYPDVLFSDSDSLVLALSVSHL